MIDTDEEHFLSTRWDKTERITLPGDTKVVTIKCGNFAESPGGILASFNNSVVTDGTWLCADMSWCTTTDCENSVNWQNATTYGVNGDKQSSWNRKMNDIESKAQWIWVGDNWATRVWCKKTFGKFIRIMHLKMIKKLFQF